MADDQVDYKNSVRDYLSSHTDSSINEEGADLVERVLNGLQKEILDKIKDNIGTDSGVSLRSTHQAIENVFEGPLQNLAVANAQRQLMLFETGSLNIDHVSQAEAEKNKTKSTAKTTAPPSAVEAAKKTVPKSVKKLLESAGLNADKEGGQFLNTRIANLLELVASQAASNCRDGRDLTAMEIKKVLDQFVAGDLLETANSEGCRCLLLHQEGLIKFVPKTPKPPKTSTKKSATPKKSTASAKKQKQSKPPKTSTKKSATPKKSAPSVKKQKLSKPPKKSATPKKSTPSVKKQKLAKPPKTSTNKSATPKKSTPSGKKQQMAKPPKKSATPKKSTPSAKKQKLSSYKPKTTSTAEPQTPVQLDFGRDIKKTCKTFKNHEVSIQRDAIENINKKLKNVCNKLISKSKELARKENELTEEDMKRAIEELFPELLAQHALANCTNNPLCGHKKSEK